MGVHQGTRLGSRIRLRRTRLFSPVAFHRNGEIVTRSQADDWSITRSLAFVAATFAIMLGTLLPFAALAASSPDHSLVICSAETPRAFLIRVDGPGQDQDKGPGGIKCAACLLGFAADLPEPPTSRRIAAPTTRPAAIFLASATAVAPPGAVPPRPPSTAPPVV